jgi:hypothetical protein
MIHQLFYVSSARGKNIQKSMVDDIVRKACAYNAKVGITGILLFKGGIFVQLLEGPKDEVQSLYRKIERDHRHGNLVKLFEITDNERLFPHWSMGLKEMGPLELKLVNEVLSWNKLLNQSERVDNQLILSMLKSFRGDDKIYTRAV